MLSLSFSLSHSLSLILSLTLSLSATNTGGCLLTCPKSTLEIKQRACLHASLTRQQSDAARSRTGPGTGHPPPVHATTPPRPWGCLWGGRARTTLTRSGFRRSRSGRCARARPPSKSSHRCTTAHVSIRGVCTTHAIAARHVCSHLSSPSRPKRCSCSSLPCGTVIARLACGSASRTHSQKALPHRFVVPLFLLFAHYKARGIKQTTRAV